MIKELLFDNLTLCCEVISMGRDVTIAVYGGDTPHIGSIVLSVPRPSLTGDGISVTSSVLNGIGHKDEEIARLFAETVARQYNCTVCCSCGIHIDNITPAQIQVVQEKCKCILNKMATELQPILK